MKTIFRSITFTLSAGVLVSLFVSSATAGCGDLKNLRGPFMYAQATASPESRGERTGGPPNASIVGLWKTQLVSLGNTTHNPSIPDGALIDFGYTQWHSDGTEILNSGGHSPASENFCLGVWGQTGFRSFQLNHFPISYDPATGAIAAFIELREQNTLSPSGDSYTGTFTLDVYDPMGNHVDHLAGTVSATRLTVDSTLPSAAPNRLN